jgi:hypothetical protein
MSSLGVWKVATMKVPLIFCTGMLRSGSTWAFNVCRLMAQVSAGKNGQIGCGYMTLEQTEEFLQTNDGAVSALTVIKTHGVGPRASRMLKLGKAKAVCTYRDPRDCVASMMSFAGEPFDVAVGRVRAGLEMMDAYTRRGQTLFIRYEDMIADRMAQIRKIAAHLEIVFEEHTLKRIDQITGLENTIEVCEQLRERPADQVYTLMNHRVDPQTWLHDNHIQSGKAGRFRQEMNGDQIQLLERMYAPWLDRLGYLDVEGPKAA